jgi:MarR family transcriptional regulator, organic hydroperoxide resistance regulator
MALPTPLRVPNEDLTDTLAFMRLLWAVDHGLRSLSKRMQASLGITGPQRLVLRLVGRFRDLSPSELAELLHVDRGTLSGILERLATRGLLVRRAHPDDGRRMLLALTVRGQRLNRDSEGTVEAAVRRALATVPASKIRAARQVLEAVARELTREQDSES